MMDGGTRLRNARLADRWPLGMYRRITNYSWPALQAVGELGGSASIGEIVETVIKREGFSDAQQAVLHNDGPETEIGVPAGVGSHVPEGNGSADQQLARRLGAN